MSKAYVRKNFHEARWDEPMIYELSTPGTRGILIPEVEDEIISLVGDVAGSLPEGVRRKEAPLLPEVDQKHVLAHWIHLSQETLGSNLTNDISEGTCTMKYNPRLGEGLALNNNCISVCIISRSMISSHDRGRCINSMITASWLETKFIHT